MKTKSVTASFLLEYYNTNLYCLALLWSNSGPWLAVHREYFCFKRFLIIFLKLFCISTDDSMIIYFVPPNLLLYDNHMYTCQQYLFLVFSMQRAWSYNAYIYITYFLVNLGWTRSCTIFRNSKYLKMRKIWQASTSKGKWT